MIKGLKRAMMGIGTFLLAGSTAGTLTYFLIPAGQNNAVGGVDTLPDDTSDGEKTPTDNFKESLTNEATTGFKSLLNFEMDIETEGLDSNGSKITSDNKITIEDGSIQFKMPSADQLGLYLDAPISYNGKTLDLGVSIADSVLYFSLDRLNDQGENDNTLNLKYKMDWNSGIYVDDNGLSHECSKGDYDIFFNEVIYAITGGDDFEIPTSITSMADSIDTASLMEQFGNMVSVKQNDGSYMYYLDLTLGDIELPIAFGSDSDYSLTKIQLPGYQEPAGKSEYIKINDKTKFKFSLDNVEYNKEDIQSPKYSTTSYHRLVDSLGLFKTIYPLVDSPKFGLDFTSTLSHQVSAATTDTNGNPIEATDESSTVTLDADADLTSKGAPQITASLALNAGESTQKVGIEYLTDAEKASTVYLNYQDVLKAKMSKLTLDDLFGRFTKDSGTNTQEDKTSSQLDSILDMMSRVKISETLKAIKEGVSSITSSDLVSGIKAGHYESAVDIIKSIEASDNKIVVTLSLAPANVEGELVITISSSTSTGEDGVRSYTGLQKVELQNIKFASFTLDGVLKLVDYSNDALSETEQADYQALNHLTTLADQVTDLTDKKQAAFTLSGSVMDTTKTNIGFDFSGDARMDVNPESSYYKSGTGSIAIVDHTADYDQTHKVNIDVVGTQNMFFTYNSGSTENTLKGRFTIDTLNDIIDLVKNLIGSEDARYTKFMDQIMDNMGTSLLSDLIDNKLNSLITTNLLVNAQFLANESKFTISKDLMGTDSDIDIDINYDEKGKLSSLDLALEMSGKKIDLTLGLSEYPEINNDFYRLDHTTSNYMDFSQLAVLMRYGLKTSEMNTYHLSATADISTPKKVFSIEGITIDLYVYVNGSTAKIYGTVHVTALGLVNAPFGTIGGSHDTTFYYLTNDEIFESQGGILYMDRKDDVIGWSKDGHYYKKVDGKVFLDDITNWLCSFVLGLNDSIMDQITSSGFDSTAQTHFEDVLTAFQYTGNEDSSSVAWDITMDMGALAHSSSLGDMTLNVKGGSDKLKSLSMQLAINVGISMNISLNANVVNLDSNSQEIECWESSGVSSKFESYIASTHKKENATAAADNLA